MKNNFMQTIGGTFLVLLMLFGAAQTFVSAQVQDSDKSNNSRQGIEGVWQTTITQRNCQTGEAIRTFRGLTTFNEGGTLSETAAGSSPVLRSPGHGVWEKEDQTTYSSSFIFLRFNPDGTFAGTQKTVQTMTLRDRSEDVFDSTGTVQILDANDNVLGMGCSTAVGTRFE